MQENPVVDIEDSISKEISSKGVPQRPTPIMFDFEHNHDPRLTPRRNWQQKVQLIDNKLEDLQKKYDSESKLF